jgi:hypothetical protein
MAIRYRAVNERHVARLQRLCAQRRVRMEFNGTVWTFQGPGVDVVAVDLRVVRDDDLVPSRRAATQE